MEQQYSGASIKDSIATFRDYLKDLEDASFDTFQTKLRLFINYCEKDDIIRYFCRVLHDNANAREWYDEVAAGRGFHLPDDPLERMALGYQILALIKQRRIDLRLFIVEYFEGHSLEDKFDDLKEKLIVDILKKGVLTRLLNADVKPDERYGIDSLAEEALTSEGPALPAANLDAPEEAEAEEPTPSTRPEKTGTPEPPKKSETASSAPVREEKPATVTPKATTNTDPEALATLEKRIREAELNGGLRGDLLLELSMVRLELLKQTPDEKRVKSMIDALRTQVGS